MMIDVQLFFLLQVMHQRRELEELEEDLGCGMYNLDLFTLPETNSEFTLKIGLPNRKGLYSNHPFSGAFAVSFREGSW